jgi:hypothetical protein
MGFTRRQFVKAAGLSTLGSAVVKDLSWASGSFWTSNSDTLKVGF